MFFSIDEIKISFPEVNRRVVEHKTAKGNKQLCHITVRGQRHVEYLRQRGEDKTIC